MGQPRLPLGDKPLYIDCEVDIVAVSKVEWEGSCECGWRYRARHRWEIERRANGHPARSEILTDP